MVKTSDCGSDMHGFESHQAPHLKEALARVFFYATDEGENPFEGSSEERAECEVLLQRVGNSEAKHVDTFNASDSRQSHQAPHKKDFGICQGLFLFE